MHLLLILKSCKLIFQKNLKVFSRNYVLFLNFSISLTLDISNFFLGILEVCDIKSQLYLINTLNLMYCFVHLCNILLSFNVMKVSLKKIKFYEKWKIKFYKHFMLTFQEFSVNFATSSVFPVFTTWITQCRLCFSFLWFSSFLLYRAFLPSRHIYLENYLLHLNR